MSTMRQTMEILAIKEKWNKEKPYIFFKLFKL